MSDNIRDIENYIDKNMSPEEMKTFSQRLETDEELKKDFLLVQELNEHMKGKLMLEQAENDPSLKEIEIETKNNIANFLSEGKSDKKTLDILSEAFADKSSHTEDLINEAENELKSTDTDELTEGWVNEFHAEKEKDADILSMIKGEQKSEEKLPDINDADAKRHNPFFGKSTLYYIIGTAAAILIMVFIINQTRNKTPLNERLYADYHKAPCELTGIQVRSDSSELNIEFEKASALYEQKKYTEAYAEFNELSKKDSSFSQAIFYSGLAQLEAGKTREAIKIFKQVLEQFDGYNLESKWYISLAFIKIQEYNKAIPFLIDLTAQKCIYQKDAEEILKELKK